MESDIRIYRNNVKDADEINAMFKHPEIFPYISDDSIEIDNIDVTKALENDDIYFLSPILQDKKIGFFMCVKQNAVSCEVHSGVLPEYRGGVGLQGAKLAVDWIFRNTDFMKINTLVPVSNKKAYYFANAVGFKNEGMNRKSFLRKGEIMDQHYLGLTKEDLCQQQWQ